MDIRKIIPAAVLATAVFVGCNKTPMKGDLEKFVGMWQWDSTYYYATDSTAHELVFADSLPDVYAFEITTKGVMYWYKNGEEVNKLNLKVKTSSCEGEPDLCEIGITYNAGSAGRTIKYVRGNGTKWTSLEGFGFPVAGYFESNVFRKVE